SMQRAVIDTFCPETAVTTPDTPVMIGACGGSMVRLTGADTAVPATFLAVSVKVTGCDRAPRANCGAGYVVLCNPGAAMKPGCAPLAVSAQVHVWIGVGETAAPNSVTVPPDGIFVALRAAVTTGSTVPGSVPRPGPSTHGAIGPATLLLTAEE